MISIVVCSRDEEIFEQFRKNVELTIGCVFEIICIHNPDGEIGICKAYNRGMERVRYDIVCFAHEDISFETKNWGEKVVQHLSSPAVGLIGVAGGDTKGWVPSSWSSFIFPSEVSLIQHFRDGERKTERIVRTGYPFLRDKAKPVASLDGVWMCTRRDVLRLFSFDENTFTGFHGYDIDFSLQVGTAFKVCVVFDVILHHYSEGSFNEEWMQFAIKLSDKWRKILPVSVRPLSRTDLVNQHWTAMRNFIMKMKSLDYNKLTITRYLIKYSFTKYFHWKHFLHFVRISLFTNGGRQR